MSRNYVGSCVVNCSPKQDFKELGIGAQLDAIREVLEFTGEFNNPLWRLKSRREIKPMLEQFLQVRDSADLKLDALRLLEVAYKTQHGDLIDFVTRQVNVNLADSYRLVDEEFAEKRGLSRIRKDMLILKYIQGITEDDVQKLMVKLGYEK